MVKIWRINSRKYIYWLGSNQVDGMGVYELNIRIKRRFLWFKYYCYVAVCSVPEYKYNNHIEGITALLETYKNRKLKSLK